MPVPDELRDLLRDPSPPLARTCAAVAAHVAPGAHGSTPDPMEVLAGIAAEVDEASPAGVVAHLYGRLGFLGDADDYHAVENSLLSSVLRRRRGMPLTLAVVVLDVAARLGVDLVPVGMPGHFLVGVPGAGGTPDVHVDPFTGALLDARGVVARFQAVHGPGVVPAPGHLDPILTGAVVERLLANLERSLVERGPRLARLRVAELRLLLPGAGTPEVARHAEALAAVGQLDEAGRAWDALADALDEPAATTARRRAALVRAGRS